MSEYSPASERAKDPAAKIVSPGSATSDTRSETASRSSARRLSEYAARSRRKSSVIAASYEMLATLSRWGSQPTTGVPSGHRVRGSMADASTSPSSPARFQILALDGGGAKALFTAHVLAHLETDLGLSVRDSFDLIAGTSAGGIIALALGAGVSPAEIVERYSRLVARVFPRSRQGWWALPRRFARSAYSAQALRQALVGVFEDRTLGDSDKRLVIPSWNSQKGGVYLFKTRHHAELTRDWRLRMVDVGLATSAAPAYFPSARVDHQRFIDGGVWANNPSLVAIAEAVKTLEVPLPAIKLLNVGTTESSLASPTRLDSAGLAGWAPHAVELILGAGSRGGQAIAQNILGKGNYRRFDAEVPGGTFALDRVDRSLLAGVAATESRELAPLFTRHFAPHLAPTFVPVPI